MSSLIKRDQSVGSLQRRVNDLFDNFFNNDFDLSFPRNFGKEFNLINTLQPKVNISEDDKNYYVEAELAGLKKENVKLNCSEDGVLSISAEKREESREEKKNYHCVECSCGSFFRSFALPGNVDRKAIGAEMKDGMLKISLPKGAKEASKATEITIK